MTDYSDHILRIQQLRKLASEYMREGRWSEAVDLADQIIVEAAHVKIYCLGRMSPDKVV
jgi:hypothetical protein